MGRIAVVDYGVGNLKSVTNALEYLGLVPQITGLAEDLERADAIILPGVGAFPDAADKLRATGLDAVIKQQAEQKPLLGICLGMQLLFEQGEEVRPCEGLGLIPGKVRKIDTRLKLPHIGWNGLSFRNDCPIFQGLEEDSHVYFVHSFQGETADPAHVAAVTDYGGEVLAAVCRGNVYGCQFHPEKSGEIGLEILRKFGELNR